MGVFYKGKTKKIDNHLYNIGDSGYIIFNDKKYELSEPLCAVGPYVDILTSDGTVDRKCRKVNLKDFNFQEIKNIDNSEYKAYIYKIENINPENGGYITNVISSHFNNIGDSKNINSPSFSYYTMLNTKSAILTLYINDEKILDENIEFIIPREREEKPNE